MKANRLRRQRTHIRLRAKKAKVDKRTYWAKEA